MKIFDAIKEAGYRVVKHTEAIHAFIACLDITNHFKAFATCSQIK
jgi:hypothetical protein